MNIFELSENEFEEYLEKKLESITPQTLLKKLFDCGLKIADEYFYEPGETYTVENKVLSCKYKIIKTKKRLFSNFFKKSKKIEADDWIRRAA